MKTKMSRMWFNPTHIKALAKKDEIIKELKQRLSESTQYILEQEEKIEKKQRQIDFLRTHNAHLSHEIINAEQDGK